MSSSSSSEEQQLFPIVQQRDGDAFMYNDSLLLSGVLAAVVKEDLKKVKELVDSGHSPNVNDNIGNTPLHVAVIKNNSPILRYLTSHDDIRINTRNFLGQTPLFIAVKYAHLESACILIENGANVNLPDNEEVTPLHRSVQHPAIAHLLIKNGAKINVVDYSDDTPLHDAVAERCLQTVHMLLYYGADANFPGGNDLTPFMKALISEYHDLQEALFDYVDDYNATSLDDATTLSLALTNDNPYVEEIIRRGAMVDIRAYRACINIPNRDNFKLVWSRLTASDAEDDDVDLMFLFYQLDKEDFADYIDIVIENSDSSLLEVLAQKTLSKDLASLVKKCADNDFLTHDQITKLVCIWLQHGFQMNTDLITEVFFRMGYCELFKILLFMDYVEDWSSFVITPRLIFDVRSDVNSRCNEIIKEGRAYLNVNRLRGDIVNSFSYWIHRPLLDIALTQFDDSSIFDHEDIDVTKFFNLLPKVPSLLELARDQTRKYIVNKFHIKTTSHYYTYVNYLDISVVYKKVLMFERKIYG